MKFIRTILYLVVYAFVSLLVFGCGSTSRQYEFPESIDTNKRYMFYLHGKIIEDQGIPAISSEYGEYAYDAILESLTEHGFIVISEQRSKNTDSHAYAQVITEQISSLLHAGVPEKHITVVGASKGAAIAIIVSHLLANADVNFVFLGACHPDTVKGFLQDQIELMGNILSIFDSEDKYAGSCDELISKSDGGGISGYEEIVLEIGTGHGILYTPLDAWILPTVDWAQASP